MEESAVMKKEQTEVIYGSVNESHKHDIQWDKTDPESRGHKETQTKVNYSITDACLDGGGGCGHKNQDIGHS